MSEILIQTLALALLAFYMAGRFSSRLDAVETAVREIRDLLSDRLSS